MTRMTDSDKVQLHVAERHEQGLEISDACARVIASWYAARTGVGQAFTTSGAIVSSPTDVWRDLTDDGRLYATAAPADRLQLDMLGTYLLNRAERGPVPGWSYLWL